ncbi:tetratricopeptide repeat protein [Hyphomonas sp.]|uniref:tetratricopeptide repeat protein n=1 Tax=Hyphomonas sp. TaxID=87 RepID=UPI00391BFBF8
MSSAKMPFAGLLVALTAASACASSPAGPEAELAKAMEAAMQPASAEEREAANRADPLTRASFWAQEQRKQPQDAAVALEFATALRAIGSEARALEVLGQAAVIHPRNADIHMMLGRIRMAAGEAGPARFAFERAAEAAPDRAETWAALGTAYDQAGDHRMAQAAYQRALTLEPSRVTTLTNYGLSLMLSGDLAGAERQLRLASAQPQADTRVQQNLALVLGLQGRFDEMTAVSGEGAPASIAEQNARLVRALVSPGRVYEALAAPGGPAGLDTEEDAGGRQLRRLRN